MWKVDFFIDKESPIEAESDIGDTQVKVKLGSMRLEVEIISASNDEEAFKKAEMAANHFLDGLSSRYGAHIKIDSQARCVSFKDESGNTKKQIYIHDTVALREHIIVIKKDTAGNIVETSDSNKPGKIRIKDSEAASYYRRAKLSSDPFDQFRNFYLVAENIGDRIKIAKAISSKNERELLEIALTECFKADTKPLENVAKGIPGFSLGGNIIFDIATLLYKGHRCQLNHAKKKEDKKIPFDPEDEKEVKQALPLMVFVASSLLQYEEQNL